MLNNKWYNVDVTSASYNIKNGKSIDIYLVKDDKMLYKANISV